MEVNSGENSETRSVEVYIQHCSPTMKGDSCFRICQIRWIKTKKVTFSQLKTSLSRNFVYNLETFRKCIFTILLQIQHENHFLPTSKHRQAKVCRFRGIEKKCIETRRHHGTVRKTENSQGYSELREPNKTRENCYSLIW